MDRVKSALSPGLYLIATPIGSSRDITLRSLDILSLVDVLVAEDTRVLRKLLEIHGIQVGGRQLLSYHDHNSNRVSPQILAALKSGKSVAYASEAGTPMVADPGFNLARAAVAEGYKLVSAPGPCAAIAALTLSGLPTDRFFFQGFLPNAETRRKSVLRKLADVPGTLVFYESPRRVAAMLNDAVETLGADRDAAICREMTKRFEEIIQGELGDLLEQTRSRVFKGELVVLVGRGSPSKTGLEDVEAALNLALRECSVRDAVERVAGQTGTNRRQVYQLALEMTRDEP